MYLEKVDEIYRNHPSNVTIAHSTCRTLDRFIEQADVTKRNDCIKAYWRLVQIASQYPHEREIQWFQLTAAFKIAEEETDPIEAMRYYQHVEQISNNKPDDKEIRSVASELGCIVLVKFGAGQFRDALEILETLERSAKKSNEWKEVYVSFATGTTCFIIKFSSEMPDLCETLYRKLQDFAQYYPDDDLIKYAMDAATESYRPPLNSKNN
jgi:dihydrodipicolinate synthase/N-acetylneuraminate lyase